MKVLSILVFICVFQLSLISQTVQQAARGNSDVKVIASSASSLTLELVTPGYDFSVTKTEEGFFNNIQLNGGVARGENGRPQLPVISKMFQIPEKAAVAVSIDESEYTDYDLSSLTGNAYPVYPQQPSKSKQRLEPAPLVYDKAFYQQNAFIAPQRATTSVVGHLRHLQMGIVDICPFDYNPATNILRVYNRLVITISFPGADLALTESLSEKYAGYCFSAVENQLINHAAMNAAKDTLTQYPVKYVIVSDIMFQDALQPLVAWKTKKGFIVDEAYTSEPAVGNTTTSINAYLQAQYDNATAADPAPSFILIVGDVAQVPAFSGTTGSHVSDMYYAEFTGDMIPDAYFGRFSATTIPQLVPQVEKTLEYEQYLFPTESWLDTVVMIAGVDGSFGPTHANGQIYYGTTNYFNATNDVYSYTHMYPASGSEDALIRSEIGAGCAFANYTAHGYENGWGDPSFDNTDIPAMNNAHKYPLMIGNACLTNSFQQSECFGEALLRASLKGAIGYIGGSNSTYWDEDFFWGVGVRSTINATPTYDANNLGAYDRTWHTHGEPFSDWYMSQGQMILAGNLAVLTGSPSSFDYYSEIYHLMGDPSLMVYLSVPTQLTVSHPALLPLGQNTITVSTEPYAYIGVSQNGVWHGAALADASGNAVISIIPFTTPGTASIVATKQFRKPYVSTFTVQTPTGPYVLMESKTIIDVSGNNNQQADFAETLNLDVKLRNYGLQNDSTVYAILSSTDPYVTILDSVGVWGLMLSNDTITLPNAYSVKIDTLVPDNHFAPFTLTIRDSIGNIWASDFSIKLNAPVLQILSMDIDDVAGGNGNHRLDAGETALLKIQVVNNGHADIWDAGAVLSSVSPYITLTTSAWQHDSLYIGIAETGTYQIEVDPSTPIGTMAQFTLDLEALTYYTASKTFSKNIGLVDEDWETGNFTQFQWTTSGDVPWIVTSGNPYEGAFTAKSGDIGDDQESHLTIDINVLSDDSLSFYKRVSSEQDWDFLKFYVNASELGAWSGEVPWTQERFWITAGPKTLKWSYIKDYSYDGGEDAAWVDYIIFPPMVVVTSTQDLPAVSDDMLVYPNPAAGNYVTITAPVTDSNVELTVYAADGRAVYSESYSTTNGQAYLPVQIQGWEPGIYTVILTNQQQLFSKSFTVIK